MSILTVRGADGKIYEILTIRGEDGKDGVNGKDGVDGKDGVNGKDGKDYVLTDEDKQEIAGMVDVGGGDSAEVTAHLSNKENPHNVTWAQVRDGAQNDIANAVATALNNASIAYVGSAAPTNDMGKDGDIYIVSG